MRRTRLPNIYSQEVWLLTNCNHKQVCDFLRKNYPKYPLAGGEASGRMEDPKDSEGVDTYYVWVDESLSQAERRLVVIHESAHLAFALLEGCGVPTDKRCDEAFTYLQESICRKLFKLLKL